MPKCSKHPILIPQLQLAGTGWHDSIRGRASRAEGAPTAGGNLIALALDGAERTTKQLQVSGGIIIQDIVITQITKNIKFINLDSQRMALLLEMLQSVFLNVAPTRHMSTAQAGPYRLGGVAVHAVPLLRVEDGVVWGQPQPPHMLTPVHYTRLPAELAGWLCQSITDCLCASLCGCVSVSHWLHITMVTMVSGEMGPSQGMVVSRGERDQILVKMNKTA